MHEYMGMARRRPAGRLLIVQVDAVEQRGDHGAKLVELVVRPGHPAIRSPDGGVAPVAGVHGEHHQRVGGGPVPRRRVLAEEPQPRHGRRAVQERARLHRVPLARVDDDAAIVARRRRREVLRLGAARHGEVRGHQEVAEPVRGGRPRHGPQPGRAEVHVHEVADRVARVGHGVGRRDAERAGGGGQDEGRGGGGDKQGPHDALEVYPVGS